MVYKVKEIANLMDTRNIGSSMKKELALTHFLMNSITKAKVLIRYRGFLLLQQHNKGWLVNPERSPLLLLPFRTHPCTVEQVKKILDIRISKTNNYYDQAA